MCNKSIIAASLVLPLLLIACNRADHSPTATGPSQERQAMNPSSPQDRMMENSPPAAGTNPTPGELSNNPSAPSSGATDSTEKAPGVQNNEPKSNY